MGDVSLSKEIIKTLQKMPGFKNKLVPVAYLEGLKKILYTAFLISDGEMH